MIEAVFLVFARTVSFTNDPCGNHRLHQSTGFSRSSLEACWSIRSRDCSWHSQWGRTTKVSHVFSQRSLVKDQLPLEYSLWCARNWFLWNRPSIWTRSWWKHRVLLVLIWVHWLMKHWQPPWTGLNTWPLIDWSHQIYLSFRKMTADLAENQSSKYLAHGWWWSNCSVA